MHLSKSLTGSEVKLIKSINYKNVIDDSLFIDKEIYNSDNDILESLKNKYEQNIKIVSKLAINKHI